MPKADGSILIDTKIDTKDVSSQMLRLENRLSKKVPRVCARVGGILQTGRYEGTTKED